MSHEKRKRSAQTTAGAHPTPAQPAVAPFKPRPRLLAILSVLFALWIAFLLFLYFQPKL